MTDRKHYRILLLAFFLSGLAALVYEIVWARKLGLVFGTTTYAISTVLAVFFTGLALGSFVFGRLVDRFRRPLLTYALLELGIGVYALLTPQIFELIKALQASFWQRFEPAYSGFNLFTLLLSAVGLIIPTTLMGGTLPAISKFFVARKETLGEKVSILYAVNTAGAVLGTILAGFVLMVLLGVNGAIYFAAAVNILVGILVLGIRYWGLGLSVEQREKRPPLPEPRPYTLAPWLLLFAYGLSGFAALALEVLWTRVLVLVIGSSTYAFSIVLITFLFGIAVGSAVISRFIDRKKEILSYFVVSQILIGLFVILSIPFFNNLPFLFARILERFSQSFWALQPMVFLFCSLIMLVPTLLMGAAFPMVVKAYRAQGLGSRVGQVYGANTIGGVLGAIVAGFVLIPLMGIQKSILLAAVIYFVVGGVILSLIPIRRAVKYVSLSVLVILAVLSFNLPSWSREKLNSGVFVYGEALLRKPASKIVFYQEGISAVITVREAYEDKSLGLQINGKFDASSKGDLDTELLSGHLPMLLHPDPKEALVIGLGSGITLGAMEQYEELEQVGAVEIEPAVVEAAKLFSEHSNDALDDPRLEVIVGDGRNYLLATDKKYDIITSELSNPWFAGNANLFTQEYYQLAKKHLKPGGIMVHWVHIYSMSNPDLKMVIKSFQSVFPHTTVWTGVTLEDFLLVGSEEALQIDLEQLDKKMRQEKVGKDLARVSIKSSTALLGYFLMDEGNTREFVEGALLHTDNFPYLEFSAPKNLYLGTIASNLSHLKKFQTSPFAVLKPPLTSQVEREIEERFEFRKHMIEAEIYYDSGEFNKATIFLERALIVDSQNPLLIERLESVYLEGGEVLESRGENEKAVEQFRKLLNLDPENLSAHIHLGRLYLKLGRLDEAKEILKKALEIDPSDSTNHMHLGVVWAQKKEFDKAEAEFKKAIELNPESFEAHNNLANLYRLQGKTDLAKEEWEKSLKINPRQPQIRKTLESLKK